MEPREYATMFALEEGHWWYRSLRRRIRRALGRIAEVEDGPAQSALTTMGTSDDTPLPRLCLDAGCGSGMLLASLPSAWTAVGCDLSATALAFARRRTLPHLARASVAELPFADACADLVVSADVIYHRDVPDDVAALREMARCLRGGGYLVLNVPAFAWLYSAHDRAIHTARRYQCAELRAKLERAGLTPVRVRYWNWLLFPPLALLRLWRRGRVAGAAPASDLRPLPAGINTLLGAVLRIEEWFDPLRLPFGLSLLAVARKETDAGSR
ncbi:MAG: methyltransferase domain-containing protein [Candidatus Eisenbacteria bacterium]|nr:methyltransferase domain-containing protein [Candidatus Eisenbacteria bacterium]